MKSINKKQLLISTLLTSAMALSAAPSYAQDSDEEGSDQVVVTGSRIVRKDLVSTSPVNVIGESALDLSGFNNVATVLNELPQAGVPGSTDTATNFRTSGTGLNTIDLRNLGTNRTLVLLNGRRHIGGSAGSPTVDVSMIPAPLVERVEVVTGGASAVYGSEAIAGVINFILKDDFEGVEVEARHGFTEAGGADDVDVSVTAGSSFADDRGNAVVHVGYSDRGILESSQRDFAGSDATNSSFGPNSGFIFGTNFITLDETTGLWDKNFVSSEDGFDRNGVRLIRVPTERIQFNANITYDLNENHTFFSETGYSELRSNSRLEPSIVGQFITVGSQPNINMPLDNAFFPTELRTAILANDPTATEVTWRRRFTEIGPRTSDVQRKVFRTALGLKGDVTENWTYEVYAQYGNTSQDQTNGGVFNALNVLQSLDTEADPNNPGGFRCRDSLARDLGCVPANFFGSGNVTGAALDWIQVSSQLTSRAEQVAAGAYVTGDLFEMPAGAVATAFGVEYRDESSAFNPDSLAASGLTSGNALAATSGGYSVTEVFGEAVVPLLADMPMVESLTLELAGRYADYTTVGGVEAYKVAGTYSPFEGLQFRGGYNTAVRAPFITELFNPGSETFRPVNDPCALGGTGAPSGNPNANPYPVQSAAVQANCATIPGTATLDPALTNIQSAGGFAAGNPNLDAETSKTITAGFVYSPKFLSNFNLTVDYFDIQIDDAINSFSAQTTVDQCVRQPTFPNNAFCNLIQRNATTGLIERIDALAINVATFEAAGVDFAADYSFDWNQFDFRAQVNGTYATKNDFVPFAGGDVVDSLGETGVPEWKVNGTFVTEWDNYTVAFSGRYIGDVNYENDQPALGKVGAFFYGDVYASYDFSERFQLFGGVDNMFDKQPPVYGQGTPGDVTGTNTAADIYDVYGRSFYIGAKARF